jgi:WD40 repeat protein
MSPVTKGKHCGQHILVSGSDDGLVKVWSVSSWREGRAASLAGHTNKVWSVAFSPDGQHCFGKWQVGEGVVVNGILLFYYISHNF